MLAMQNRLKKLRFDAIAALLVVLIPMWGCGGAKAGPTVLVGKTVPTSERISIDAIDHDDWDQLLVEFVDDQGMVDYKRWKSSQTHMRQLDVYLEELSRADLKANATREAKLAYWINAYNAVTVRGILREYPTSSIRNHTARLVGYNIWKNLKLQVAGQQVSLDAMEHEVLRKMGEPRIHFAIVCASIGCPKLRNEAYKASSLDEQLDSNASDFFADPSKFKFDQKANVVSMSPILDWFAGDFGSDQRSRLKYVSQFVPEKDRTGLQANGLKLKWLEYDWGLNQQ